MRSRTLKNIQIVLILLLVFMIGWTAKAIIPSVVYLDKEKPFSISFKPLNKGIERLSPGDHVIEEQIHVFGDKIVLDISDASWGSFTDTNSMDPFLDVGSNSIEIRPKTADQVNVGDVVSYYTSEKDLIIHRVIEKDVDEKGVYYILKGDNNHVEDPEKVRFEQINGILVGIIY
ncbi:signal peptidase I [Candidatus Woesearchaeota archaeon]|nr:signal peptidase I [Candidatus Woesearchaeota archaeon]MBT6519411.1 signal peptidase I [Candidatus Woesearchaeota archaeon]MBT7368083.1 signal peptidase I [Candidatus Woesearchaeota archaeon]